MKTLIPTIAICLLRLTSLGAALDAKSFSALPSPGADERLRTGSTRLYAQGKLHAYQDEVRGYIDIVSDQSYFNMDGGVPDHVWLWVRKAKDAKPLLFLEVVHTSRDIRADTADFRLGSKAGDPVVNLVNGERSRDDFGSAGVVERVRWQADRKDVQTVIKAVSSGVPVLCEIGKLKDLTLPVRLQPVRQQFSDMLVVYFALGGEPLNK